MARIPTYISQANLDTGRGTRPRAEVEDDVARAVSRIGGAVAAVGEQLHGAELRAEEFNARRALVQTSNLQWCHRNIR